MKKIVLHTVLTIFLLLGGLCLASADDHNTTATNAATGGASNGVNTANPLDDCYFEAWQGGDKPFTIPDCLRPRNAAQPAGLTYDGQAGGVRFILSFIAGGVAALAGVAAILFIMYNGLMLTLSAGDEGRRTTALKGLQWAILGLILVIFAYVIVRNVIDVVTTVGNGREQNQQQQSSQSSTSTEGTTNDQNTNEPVQMDVPETAPAPNADQQA